MSRQYFYGLDIARFGAAAGVALFAEPWMRAKLINLPDWHSTRPA
jgi:hypothetical protein